MGNYSKKVTNLSDFFKVTQAMLKHQKVHNVLRKDYLELLRITENHKAEQTEFDALYRASIRSLFSLIEADLYGYNKIYPYPGFKKEESFEKKFKQTFNHIFLTWEKDHIREKYFNEKYFDLKQLRSKRNDLAHPKLIDHIHIATETKFEKVKQVFEAYDKFINDLMNNFFIEIDEIKLEDLNSKK